MDRINGAGTTDIGGGRRGFRDENLGAGVEGTEVTALWCNLIQEEIMKVCVEAGLTPSEADWTQLYQAIGIMMDALFADVEAAYPFASTAEAIAGLLLNKIISPKTLADVLTSRLAAYTGPVDSDTITYLNVFPAILTADTTASITGSVGQIVVNPFKWVWRQFKQLDVNSLNLAARTFVTAASKTYHLRLSYNVGTGVQTLSLKDLSNAGYNPSGLVEGATNFDTTYDDMILARVVTNAGNVPTMVPLKNASRMNASAQRTSPVMSPDPAIGFVTDAISLNWGRRPAQIALEQTTANVTIDADSLQSISSGTPTRYGIDFIVGGTSTGSTGYYMTLPYKIGISA
ncbi:hypothetical protein [Rhizobium leguminosarum]|uniref:hypothetical protein n=1 Tax=Rhizobium leguminosarum TaxID=384 RepID=UPI00140F8C3B|nr:hypothetical protein [Rhizobium leguminosarum]QIO68207.1 hypothetical protein HA462_25275 [Rhizobium leguminosarum bv. trifolii]